MFCGRSSIIGCRRIIISEYHKMVLLLVGRLNVTSRQKICQVTVNQG
jgi:hypothetical protein